MNFFLSKVSNISRISRKGIGIHHKHTIVAH